MYKTNKIVESELDGEFMSTIQQPTFSRLKSHLLTVRTEDIEAHIEKLKGAMTSEGKVTQFGIWQAETYADKMLVNAVLSSVISYFEGLLTDNKK